MSLTWPNRQLTLEEWDALPAVEGVRMELVEGLVVMAPMPLSWHQKASMRIGYRLDEQLPADLTALPEVDVVLVTEPPTVRIPDVMVTQPRSTRRTRRDSPLKTCCSSSRSCPTAPAGSTAF